MIVVNKITDNESRKIFELLWHKQVYNVVILYESVGGVVKALGFNSFTPTSCDNVENYEITNFTNLFPDKAFNLKGCPIKVHAPVLPPFVIFENKKAEGRDIDLIKILANALHFTLNLKVLTHEGAWGMIFENGTATHSIRSLLDSEADIIISEFYLRSIRLKFIEASREYFQTDIVFVIPPGRNLSSIEKLLQPFSKTVRMVLLISLLVLFAIIFLINRVFKVPMTNQSFGIFFKIFSIIFAVSLPRLPKNSSARLLLVSLTIFCLVYQAAYQGSLYRFFKTRSKEKDAETIAELILSDINFFAFDLMLESIENDKRITERCELLFMLVSSEKLLYLVLG